MAFTPLSMRRKKMRSQCPICNAILEEEFNYCPMCGEPLTSLAIKREQIKLSNAGYEKLIALAESTPDIAVAKAVKDFITRK